MDSPSDICVICQDTLGDPASHVKLECGHVLHGQCMVDALTRSLRCPICRFNLSKNTLPNIVFWSYDPPTGIGTSYISRPSYRVGAAPPPVAAPLARASRRLLRTRTSPCALRPTLRARFSVRHGRKGNVPTPEPTSPRRLCFVECLLASCPRVGLRLRSALYIACVLGVVNGQCCACELCV